jgi:hypothetical protein
MMKRIFAAFSLMAVCAVQAGIVVDAQSDVPRRVCTDQLTFSWDWSWDWIPPSAQEATLTVRKTGGGACFFSNVVGRAVSSATWNIGNLLAANADTSVDVTLSFPCADKLRASRTVTYEIREGSFGAHVRACETNSAAWRKFELPTTFAYNVNWFTGVTNKITWIQWKNLDDPSAPLIGPPNDFWRAARDYGFVSVQKDYLPRATYLASIHQWNTRLAQCEISNVTGMSIILK